MEEAASARDLVWDGENVLREQEGAMVVAQYTHAPERYGALVSQRRGNATSFHHFDALGSTERLTDASQGALISYLYRAFGEQTILTGSHANPLTWVGRLGYYRQGDSADYWLRARVYRPQVGRFVSRDARRRDGNLYRCVRNMPTRRVDPSGLGCTVAEELGRKVAWCSADCPGCDLDMESSYEGPFQRNGRRQR